MKTLASNDSEPLKACAFPYGYPLLAIVLILSASLAYSQPSVDLKLKKLFVGEENLELSGLSVDKNGQFWGVTDKNSEHFIYQINLKESVTIGRFQFSPKLNLASLMGFQAYLNSIRGSSGSKRQHFDFEAIAQCGDDFFLANERQRHILKITSTRLINIPLPKGILEEIELEDENAGIEGLAIDCGKGVIFIAKERDPKRLYAFTLNDQKLLFRGEPKLKKLVPNQPQDPREMSTDYSDLYFFDGHLYALERSIRKIAKIDPNNFQVVERYSYFDFESGIYDSSNNYGLAEALVVTKNEFWIGLDHNRVSFSPAGEKQFKIKGAFPIIFVFHRP